MATPDPAAPNDNRPGAVRAHHGVPAERLLPQPGVPAVPVGRRGEEAARREGEPRGRGLRDEGRSSPGEGEAAARGAAVGLPRGDDRRPAHQRAQRCPARDQRPGLARAQRVLRPGTAHARAPLRSRHVGCGLCRRLPAVPEPRRRLDSTGGRPTTRARASASTTSMPTRSSTSARAGPSTRAECRSSSSRGSSSCSTS